MVSPGSLESPFAETSLHVSSLDLLVKEIDLAAQRLALFVHGTVTIDLSHETPVVDGKFVEFLPESGEGCATSSQGGQKPPWKGPGWVVVIIVVIFFWGVEVGDEGKIPQQVILGVPGHLPSIHSLDPFGRAAQPIFAREINVDLSSVLFISWRGFLEWLFCIDPLRWDSCPLKIVEGFFKEPFFDGVSIFDSMGSLSHSINDAVEHCTVHVFSLGDISHRPWG